MGPRLLNGLLKASWTPVTRQFTWDSPPSARSLSPPPRPSCQSRLFLFFFSHTFIVSCRREGQEGEEMGDFPGPSWNFRLLRQHLELLSLNSPFVLSGFLHPQPVPPHPHPYRPANRNFLILLLFSFRMVMMAMKGGRGMGKGF